MWNLMNEKNKKINLKTMLIENIVTPWNDFNETSMKIFLLKISMLFQHVRFSKPLKNKDFELPPRGANHFNQTAGHLKNRSQ